MDKIRLNKTDSIHSENKETGLEIKLETTSKQIVFNNVRKTIDSYQVYLDERSKSERYRLILTINPFCTNVLFNPMTEIVKYIPINNGVRIERILDSSTVNGIDGTSTSKRVQFIADTTYSNEENGYIYYPGYDIFDNHILRCNSFSVINDTIGGDKQVFNTMYDVARDMNGDVIKTVKRAGGAKSKPSFVKKHVYNYDTLMSFEDSINTNLTEQDGWLGFSNTTKLETYNKKDEVSKWCRVLNNHSSSEFIQMYPDRSLYSFTPNYNEFLNRLEYNWDVIITYPYQNDYDVDLVKFANINALRLYSGTIQRGLSGENIVMFRSITKHNLERNNYVNIMWRFKYEEESNGTTVVKIKHVTSDTQYRVANVGNLKNEHFEYYFYIDDKTLIDEINNSLIGEVDFDNITFYMQKITNGLPSKYYFRKFKKLDYGGDIIAKEQYNLGFATTIYNDGVTQITFTDNIDFSNLTDNLGRPVCQFFITFLKTNNGNKEWYDDKNVILQNKTAQFVENSHCFTKLTDGIVAHFETNDYTNDTLGKRQKETFNIRFIGGENHNWLSEYKILKSTPNNEWTNEKWEDWVSWHGITKEQDWFYGDVVEFISNEYKEYVIADVNYRFNTYQRENPDALNEKSSIVYHSILHDDYDFGSTFEGLSREIKQEPRDEGYFYKPHYPIRIKEDGEVEQGGHYTVRLRNADVVQNEGVYLRIISMQSSNLNLNDVILLMDDKNGVMFEFRVVYIISKTTFLICPINDWFGEDGFINESLSIYGTPLTWSDIVEHLRRGQDMFLRRKNENIPSYAVLVGRNTFLWRKVYNSGEKDVSILPEYIFANNAFYVTPVINFYVKRQDPRGYFGLYKPIDQNPQDIAGVTKKKTDIYEYKDTEKTAITC